MGQLKIDDPGQQTAYNYVHDPRKEARCPET